MIIRSRVFLTAGSLLLAAALVCLGDDHDLLSQRHLILPIEGLTARDIHDTFDQGRPGGKSHEASDLLAPRGTPILAVEDGVIQKLFLSKPGGTTIYEFDPQSVFCYYYAHLDRYGEGLKEGLHVKQGEVIGFVGTSGNAPPNAPHLHFAIFKLGMEKHWWQGAAINPYPLLMKLATSSR